MANTYDYENLKLFYIGKQKKDGNSIPLVYQNKDLLTHAAIIGMTGSGKTGLGITLLEEAAIDNIPSIIIDPKGDMTNLLLNFPNMQKEDFIPWIEEQEAINNGMSIEDFAQNRADLWKKGLEKDFQDLQRVEKLKNSADFTIYTPGSDAGIQVSILSSFKAPSHEVLEDNELLTSLISSTVASILALIEEKNDSNSKESILLSSIFMHNFKEQKDLSLEELINQIVTPPFSKVGVFDLDTFFAQSQRLQLALKLNAIIANPAFSTWIEGEPLNISNMLYDDQGKAKVNIFSIAHLNDSQRMFFVTILLNELLAWMRRQEGTTSLKALLYMDEIFGYFPPLGNPPSKQPMLTLLKQARSFGIGIVLSTQNPVDIDYKGLANIGTWFIGRLQTKQDVEKVIDGLSSASENGLNKAELSNLLTNLEKRNFVLSNVNDDGIEVFETRWALSYLKGPIPKDGIKKLMNEKKEVKKLLNQLIAQRNPQQNSQEHIIDVKKGISKPIIMSKIDEVYSYVSENSNYYLQPYLLCSSNVRFVNASKGIDQEEFVTYKYYLNEEMKNLSFDEFEEFFEDGIDTKFDSKEKANSSYFEIPNFIKNDRDLKTIEKDFADFLYRNSKFTIFSNNELKLSSKQHESLSDFRIRLKDRLNEKIDEEIEKLKIKFQKENDSLNIKLSKLYERLENEQAKAKAKTTETIINIGTSLLGAFFGGSRSSTASTIGKVAASAKNANKLVGGSSSAKIIENDINIANEQLQKLQENLEAEVAKIKDAYDLANCKIEETYINPRRTDIYNTKLELLWQEQ